MESKQKSNKHSCVLIGMDSLLLECAERLLDREFSLQAILTDAPSIQDWARRHAIPVFPARDLVAVDLAQVECDFLFSITWLEALPEHLRVLPRIAAINIQDSPLPRYSGPHGPAWALMAEEQEYGICWHLAEEQVGAGGILKQVPVLVEKGENSLSLNMKCFQAALEGFEALLEDLADGKVQSMVQDETRRRRFEVDQRPAHWGCVDWAQSAQSLEAMVRALDYGSYSNPFCMAKLVLGDWAVGVSAAIAEPSQESVEAGVILAASSRGLVVATVAGNLRILSCKTLRGKELGVMEVVATAGLQVGQVLAAPHVGFLTGLAALLPGIAASERIWVQRLGAGDSLRLAYDQNPALEPDAKLQHCPVEVPQSFLRKFALEERRSALRAASLVHLARLSRQQSFRVRYADESFREGIHGFESLLSASVPLGVEFQELASFQETMELVDLQVSACHQLPPFLKDLQARSMDSGTHRPLSLSAVAVVCAAVDPQPEGSFLVYKFEQDGSFCLDYAANRLQESDVQAMAAQLTALLGSIAADPQTPIAHLDLLPESAREKALVDWNATTRPLPGGLLVHELIRAKAETIATQVAVVAAGKELTYQELQERSDHLALYLASLGAKPDTFVGICMQRTTDMMVALLAVLKSGAAYLPLDPDFPPSRLQYMAKDSGVKIVITDCWSSSLVDESVAHVVLLDEALPSFEPVPLASAQPNNMAYVIYTSGSTGDPKGVVLEHEQVTNFFLGMDERLGTEPGVWLAVTSLSFDISVLELLWTLSRGYKVVLFEGFDRGLGSSHAPAPHAAGQLEFSLMLWGASGGGPGAPNPYRLMLDAARFGDTHGFRAIWLPERHFHEFGGPYPNPAVAAAAIASVTQHVGIRTGSVVLPFHNPVLMAEDWAMVDNLSGGRVGLGIASGWHPNDFVLEPESYADRKQVMRKKIGILRSLWRGEPQELPNPVGETPEIITRPRPVQPELPIWLTAAGNPETFRLAGEMGVHVLTHLLGQTTEEIVEKIGIYRQAWREAGHPGSGHVTMMLHTMLGQDREEMREMARGPMCSYLATAADLLKDHMSAWAAVRTPMNKGKLDTDFHLSDLDPQDVQDLLDFAYDRYFETDALFGTPESCLGMVERLRQLEVDEVACLIDFGGEPEVILRQLPYLEELKRKVQSAEASVETRENLEDLITQHQVTHLQCTPSMATMLLAEPAIAQGLGTLQVMMVGGEALTEDLARKLREIVPGRVMNMYGLTETAIWSSTADIEVNTAVVSLGLPLANNRFYVLDGNMELLPQGVPGELYIAGLCVARGYLGRPDLTAKVFLQDPFDSSGKGRIYRSGDQVCQLEDGTVRFLGRGDQQVKVNGYRIELGEIESAMLLHEDVSQAVVLVVANKLGVRVLVAHYVLEGGSSLELEDLRSFLRTRLPEYMIPREFHVHDQFPKTNNGKTDRKALASGVKKLKKQALAEAVVSTSASAVVAMEASTPLGVEEMEQALEKIWLDILGLDSLNREANFFDLGGHSLLTISLKQILKAEMGFDVPLVALFRYSTVSTLAVFLAKEYGEEAKETACSGSSNRSGSGPGTPVQSAAAKRAALRKSRRGRG